MPDVMKGRPDGISLAMASFSNLRIAHALGFFISRIHGKRAHLTFEVTIKLSQSR